MSTPSTSSGTRQQQEPEKRASPGTRVSLSVIMPGLNEEDSIGDAVRRMRNALEEVADEFEIIIINDGSSDRTGEIADRLSETHDHIRVLHNEQNVNYGISLARGIQAARCEWVLHDGMDLPLAPEDIAGFTAHFADADVLVASCPSRDAHSPWRKVTSWVNRMLLWSLFRPRTRDMNFCQFYRRSFAAGVELSSTSPAFVTPELVLRAEHQGLRVLEIPVEFRRRTAGSAHFGKLHDILWTLRDMARVRVRTLLHGWGS